MIDIADASLPLQQAIATALVGDKNGVGGNDELRELIADRVYDEVPRDGAGMINAQKPYVSFGPENVFSDAADDYDGSDSRVQLDAWSAGPGRVEVKQIMRLMRAILDGAELALGEAQRVVSLTFEQSHILREPDGRTLHGVLIVRARTEPAA